ncbi:MAG: hypothetical protein OXU42_17525, partial [Deltaproteobacteria bacterium]|nr:hypothetical protein [Deltaproteobacteria bacterium]
PILIAVVLADIVEKYLWLSANSYGWAMFQRPQFLAIIAVMVLVMVVSLRMQQGAKRAAEESAREADETEPEQA